MTATTKTTKTVNYTPEQEATLSAMWIKGETTEKIAEALGKSVRSIVAKLSRTFKGTDYEYKAKVHTRKDGAPIEKKNDTADAIGKILQLKENDVDSLTKCTRVTLQAIFKALANSVPVTPENSPALAAKIDGDDNE